MNEMIKLANNQLNRTPDDQIVKVAGILRRLKNWLKSKFDPEFEQQVRQLESESAEYSIFIEQLASQVSRVQEAIKDKELDEYRSELIALKNLLNQGTVSVVSSIKDTNNLQRAINQQLSRFFSKEHAKDESYKEKIKKWLKETLGYDIPIEVQNLNIKFKDSEYYKKINLSDSNITYTPIAANTLRLMILEESQQPKYNNIFSIEKSNLNLDSLIMKAKQAIINGTINEVIFQEPNQQYKSPKTGTLKLTVSSDFFTIPNTDIECNFEVILRDESTNITQVGKDMAATRHFNIGLSKKRNVTSRSEFYSQILKTAQTNERPYKVTTLSELQFANVLKEGYKMAFGQEPSLPVLAFGWAQAALESGRPFKLPQNNVGNIKATKDWINSGKPYFKRTTEEFTAKGEKYLYSDAAWRAYNTPQEGAAGYWYLLKSRFPDALEWAASGDPQSAGVVLGQKGYYTASIKKYSTQLQSLYKTFLDKYASSFPSLKSETINTGKERPLLKDWKSDYSKDEMESRPSSIALQDNPANDDASELLNTLLKASSKDSAYYSFVKQAIYKNMNPKKNTLILICGSDEVDNLEYANSLSYLIQDYLRGVTTIHQNDNDIYIQASSHTDCDLRKAIIELSNVLSEKMKNKNNKNVFAIVSNDLFSIHKKVSHDKMISNHRKFIMRYS